MSVCALFLIVGQGVLDDYGVSTDERTQHRIAQRSLHAIVSGYETAWPEDQSRNMRFYGTAFEWQVLLAERSLGLTDSRDVYLTRHLLIHLVFLRGGLSEYMLVYRLFDSRVLVVFALLVFVLRPRLYAHSFFNSKDIPFASMFMVALVLHRAGCKDTVGVFILCGVGVPTNLRIMRLLLVPVVVALRAGDWWVAGRSATCCGRRGRS